MSETLDAPAPDTTTDTSAADDLRSAIGAAFDEHDGPDTPDTTRDDRGRFAGNSSADGSLSAPSEARASEASSAPVAEAPAIEAPATLSADDLSRWATLPRDAQELIAQREAKAAETVRALEPVQSVLKQYEPLYAARGIPAPQALASLFEAQRMLETRPAEAIAVLARQYGVPIHQAGANPSQPQDEITQLVAHVRNLEAKIAEREQAAEQTATQTIEQTIRQFAANPEHRHFPIVRNFMGALMQADPALDLPRAYEMACRAHPDVSKIIAADAEKATNADKAKRAAEAKGKAVSVRGAPPMVGNGAVPDSVRGVLSAAWDGALH